MKLSSMISSDRLSLNSQNKSDLRKTSSGDVILLKGADPSKAYIIIKLALIDLSKKLVKGPTSPVFGQAAKGESEEQYRMKIKKRVANKLQKVESLKESFKVEVPSQIQSNTVKGVLRTMIECMFPFTAKINALQTKLEQEAYTATFTYLRESLISEIDKAGVHKNG